MVGRLPLAVCMFRLALHMIGTPFLFLSCPEAIRKEEACWQFEWQASGLAAAACCQMLVRCSGFWNTPPSLVGAAISNNYQIYQRANKLLMICFVVDVVPLALKT
jgi:hypothetical protein